MGARVAAKGLQYMGQPHNRELPGLEDREWHSPRIRSKSLLVMMGSADQQPGAEESVELARGSWPPSQTY